jgi:hypothetical protein
MGDRSQKGKKNIYICLLKDMGIGTEACDITDWYRSVSCQSAVSKVI